MTQLVAIAIAFTACVTDLRSRRIPNILTFGAAAAAMVFHVSSGQSAGLLQSLEGWLVGAAIFFVPFALGGLGAGDVKLLAALGAWLGPVDALWIGLYTGIAGGIFALVVAGLSGYLGQALSNIWLLFSHWRVVGIRPVHEITLEGSKGPRLAYAIPIFAGLLVTVWLRS